MAPHSRTDLGQKMGQVMPDDIKPLLVTHVDYSSAKSYGIHMWTTSQEMIKLSVPDIILILPI